MSRILILILALGLALSGNSAKAQDDQIETLRVGGSDVLGAKLVPDLAQSWLRGIGYEGLRRQALGPQRLRIIGVRDDVPVAIEVDSSDSDRGMSSLIAGEANVAMLSRPLTAADDEAAWQLGDLRSPTQEWVVAIDGLVVVTRRADVAQLGVAQLRDLLAGRLRDWKQLGAAPGAVHVHLGADRSRTDELARRMLGLRSFAATASRHADLGAVVAAVRADPDALGVVGLTTSLQGLRTVAIADGGRAVRPTALTIRSEDYPLTERLRLHTSPMAGALGRGFVEFAISPAGQAVVERSGFVSVRPTPFSTVAAGELGELVGDARRLSATLRFSNGLDFLDSRSRQDIERIATLVKRDREPGRREILLIGFADPTPKEPFRSLTLSQERVDLVANELQQLGVRVARVRGLGGQANLAPAGSRSRNERVEVWMR